MSLSDSPANPRPRRGGVAFSRSRDDSNVARFTRMVSEYATNTQFVIITHNKRTMESAGLLYGVTMEEPGVSKLISVQLH